MIRRIIIFTSLEAKQNAILLAKKLNGYVDVEDIAKENKHIDIKTFSFIIFISDNQDLINSIILKYNLVEDKVNLFKFDLSEVNNLQSISFISEKINKQNINL